MIIFGVIFLAINQAIGGSGRPRGSPMGLGMNYICPQCDMEFIVTNTSILCPNCHVPLRADPTYVGTQDARKPFCFENQ